MREVLGGVREAVEEAETDSGGPSIRQPALLAEAVRDRLTHERRGIGRAALDQGDQLRSGSARGAEFRVAVALEGSTSGAMEPRKLGAGDVREKDRYGVRSGGRDAIEVVAIETAPHRDEASVEAIQLGEDVTL